jgi:hypothetical protein
MYGNRGVELSGQAMECAGPSSVLILDMLNLGSCMSAALAHGCFGSHRNSESSQASDHLTICLLSSMVHEHAATSKIFTLRMPLLATFDSGPSPLQQVTVAPAQQVAASAIGDASSSRRYQASVRGTTLSARHKASSATAAATADTLQAWSVFPGHCCSAKAHMA